jgi:hypothetical protein
MSQALISRCRLSYSIRDGCPGGAAPAGPPAYPGVACSGVATLNAT